MDVAEDTPESSQIWRSLFGPCLVGGEQGVTSEGRGAASAGGKGLCRAGRGHPAGRAVEAGDRVVHRCLRAAARRGVEKREAERF